jgi:hypothetical protein
MGCFGKRHLGYGPPYLPTNQGFDEYRGLLSVDWGVFSVMFSPVIVSDSSINTGLKKVIFGRKKPSRQDEKLGVKRRNILQKKHLFGDSLSNTTWYRDKHRTLERLPQKQP